MIGTNRYDHGLKVEQTGISAPSSNNGIDQAPLLQGDQLDGLPVAPCERRKLEVSQNRMHSELVFSFEPQVTQ